MIVVDTSVVVAAFAPWHEDHDVAMRSLRRRPHLAAHCGLETYAVLTRLAEPFRAPGVVAAEYLATRFGERWLSATDDTLRTLPSTLAHEGIFGGASYDALVAVTARDHDATLHTLDRRAESIYRSLGARYKFIGRPLSR